MFSAIENENGSSAKAISPIKKGMFERSNNDLTIKMFCMIRRERAGLKNAMTTAISGIEGALYKTGKNLVDAPLGDAPLEDALLEDAPLSDALVFEAI